ncbi:hypothetical protein ACVBEF_00320 [Glaciimonas sp. GG7]
MITRVHVREGKYQSAQKVALCFARSTLALMSLIKAEWAAAEKTTA